MARINYKYSKLCLISTLGGHDIPLEINSGQGSVRAATVVVTMKFPAKQQFSHKLLPRLTFQ